MESRVGFHRSGSCTGRLQILDYLLQIENQIRQLVARTKCLYTKIQKPFSQGGDRRLPPILSSRISRHAIHHQTISKRPEYNVQLRSKPAFPLREGLGLSDARAPKLQDDQTRPSPNAKAQCKQPGSHRSRHERTCRRLINASGQLYPQDLKQNLVDHPQKDGKQEIRKTDALLGLSSEPHPPRDRYHVEARARARAQLPYVRPYHEALGGRARLLAGAGMREGLPR